MDSLIRSMRWDEEVFGLEYDLDVFNIAAVSDFNMGAMENKGLNVFNTKYVLASAGDRDRRRLPGHRDRHRARVFPQLDRQPGHLPRLVPAQPEGRADGLPRPGVHRRHGQPRGQAHPATCAACAPRSSPRMPGRWPIRCGPTATSRSTISTRRRSTRRAPRWCGCCTPASAPTAFRKGMDLYIARNDNQAVTIEDFVAAMQDASGVDLSAFAGWYDQAGTPEVTAEDRYDPRRRRYDADPAAVARRRRRASREARRCPSPSPWGCSARRPPAADPPGRRGRRASEGTRLLLLEGAEQRFVFEDVPAPPVPSLLRGFSAPVRLKGVPREPLRFLAVHDTDPFVRWEAGQQYATALILDLVAAHRRGEPLGFDEALAEAALNTLAGAEYRPRLRRRGAGPARRGRGRRPDGGRRPRGDPPGARAPARRASAAAAPRRCGHSLRWAGRAGPLSHRRPQHRPPLAAQFLPRLSGRGRRRGSWPPRNMPKPAT